MKRSHRFILFRKNEDYYTERNARIRLERNSGASWAELSYKYSRSIRWLKKIYGGGHPQPRNRRKSKPQCGGSLGGGKKIPIGIETIS